MSIPGPGNYTYDNKSIGKDCLNTKLKSFASKTGYFDIKNSEVPGPGQYPIQPLLNKQGKQCLSKFLNQNITKFNPKVSKRFNYVDREMKKKNQIPGPGKYNDKSYDIGKLSVLLSHIPSKRIPNIGASSKRNIDKFINFSCSLIKVLLVQGLIVTQQNLDF